MYSPNSTWVCDIETDGLIATKIWCIVAKNVDTKEVRTFVHGNSWEDFRRFASTVSCWVMHNGISYDRRWLHSLAQVDIPEGSVIDTLILSHLLKYKLEGGHSLEAWGDRLGLPKVGKEINFTTYSDEILQRCIRDVEINLKTYEYLKAKILDRKEFKEAVDTEMQMAHICQKMHEDGFAFNIDKAKEILKEVEVRVSVLDVLIKEAFKPRTKFVREITPRLTKHGTISKANIPRNWDDYTVFSPDAPFSLVVWEEFNPTSPKQIVERLNEAGWKPVDKTTGHIEAEKTKDHTRLEQFKVTGWKVNEANLSTLPEGAPKGALVLVERLMLETRLRTLRDWIERYNPDTGRVHGSFNTIGTWTHRMSHKEPNLGNVAAEKSIKYNTPYLKGLATELGGRMRSLWIASEGAFLVGCDMESAHLRIFAHLIDDDKFRTSLLLGDKKLGTDPHSVNKRTLGDVCPDRDRAKTFIFTFLNGGGSGKVASIFGCSTRESKRAVQTFIESLPGLQHFKESDAEAWAKRGYFVGPDGRFVVCDSSHHMLAGYLQNYEATLMKKANILWRSKANDLGITYKQVNFVHDEFVTEVYGTEEDARTMGKLQADAIREVGEIYGLRCPMAGEYKVGKNWLEVH